MSIRNASCAALAALGLAVAFAPAAVAQNAEQNTEDGREAEIGLGVAAGLASILYAPAKMLYAGTGGLVAGLAYVFSAGDKEITEPILTPALRGDYVVTPSMLRGERPIEFIGRAPEPLGADTNPAEGHPIGGDGLDSAPAVSSAASEPR